jgi:hypothetical protein
VVIRGNEIRGSASGIVISHSIGDLLPMVNHTVVDGNYLKGNRGMGISLSYDGNLATPPPGVANTVTNNWAESNDGGDYGRDGTLGNSDYTHGATWSGNSYGDPVGSSLVAPSSVGPDGGTGAPPPAGEPPPTTDATLVDRVNRIAPVPNAQADGGQIGDAVVKAATLDNFPLDLLMAISRWESGNANIWHNDSGCSSLSPFLCGQAANLATYTTYRAQRLAGTRSTVGIGLTGLTTDYIQDWANRLGDADGVTYGVRLPYYQARATCQFLNQKAHELGSMHDALAYGWGSGPQYADDRLAEAQSWKLYLNGSQDYVDTSDGYRLYAR